MRKSLVFVALMLMTTHLWSQQDLARAYNEKLTKIILPNIEFRSTTLKDAVEFLRQEGRRLDPTTKDPDWAGIPVSVEVDAQTLETRLTLTFSRIPLSEAFQYVARQAGAKIEVDAKGVHVRPHQAAVSTIATATPSFDAAVAASKARVNAKYPALSQVGSPLYGKVVATVQQWRKTSPEFFQNPNWPESLVEACAADLVKNPALYTAQDIINYWEKHLPVASPMDAEYSKYERQRTEFHENIRNGSLIESAQDQANLLNIPLLTAAGKLDQAEALQRNRVADQRKLTDAATAKTAAETAQASVPTQYNGQPLPANWIDPQEADRRYAAQQQQAQLDQARNDAAQARFEAQIAQDAARKAADDARYEAMKANTGW